MRGTATAHLMDGPYAGAFVQVEATDGRPSARVYFSVVEGRVVPMPRDGVTQAVLNAAGGRWQLYGRVGDHPAEGAWGYRALPAVARPVPRRVAGAADAVEPVQGLQHHAAAPRHRGPRSTPDGWIGVCRPGPLALLGRRSGHGWAASPAASASAEAR